MCAPNGVPFNDSLFFDSQLSAKPNHCVTVRSLHCSIRDHVTPPGFMALATLSSRTNIEDVLSPAEEFSHHSSRPSFEGVIAKLREQGGLSWRLDPVVRRRIAPDGEISQSVCFAFPPKCYHKIEYGNDAERDNQDAFAAHSLASKTRRLDAGSIHARNGRNTRTPNPWESFLHRSDRGSTCHPHQSSKRCGPEADRS